MISSLYKTKHASCIAHDGKSNLREYLLKFDFTKNVHDRTYYEAEY